MGRRNQIKPYLLLSAGDLSQASITGNESTVAQIDVINLTVTWSGAQATNGNLTIEYWNSSVQGWIALDFGATISLNGATGSHQITITDIAFEKIRPVYTRTNGSASGTLNIVIVASVGGA